MSATNMDDPDKIPYDAALDPLTVLDIDMFGRSLITDLSIVVEIETFAVSPSTTQALL